MTDKIPVIEDRAARQARASGPDSKVPQNTVPQSEDGLLKLPSELHMSISDRLNIHDLSSLRAACKKLSTSLEPLFYRDARFHLIFDHDQRQDLEDIVKHSADKVRHIKLADRFMYNSQIGSDQELRGPWGMKYDLLFSLQWKPKQDKAIWRAKVLPKQSLIDQFVDALGQFTNLESIATYPTFFQPQYVLDDEGDQILNDVLDLQFEAQHDRAHDIDGFDKKPRPSRIAPKVFWPAVMILLQMHKRGFSLVNLQKLHIETIDKWQDTSLTTLPDLAAFILNCKQLRELRIGIRHALWKNNNAELKAFAEMLTGFRSSFAGLTGLRSVYFRGLSLGEHLMRCMLTFLSCNAGTLKMFSLDNSHRGRIALRKKTVQRFFGMLLRMTRLEVLAVAIIPEEARLMAGGVMGLRVGEVLRGRARGFDQWWGKWGRMSEALMEGDNDLSELSDDDESDRAFADAQQSVEVNADIAGGLVDVLAEDDEDGDGSEIDDEMWSSDDDDFPASDDEDHELNDFDSGDRDDGESED